MAGIKYYKNKDIDFIQWDNCIDNTKDAPIYGYSWYLDSIADGKWDAIIVGNYEAVFPLPFKRKFGIPIVYQPFFCQQLGLFGLNNADYDLEEILKEIPVKFLKVYLQLRNTKTSGKKWIQRTNYVLELHASYLALAQAFSPDCKKNLRKIEKADIRFVTDEDYEPVIDLYRIIWGPLNPHVKEKHYQLFSKACNAASIHKRLICIHAFQGNIILGRAIFFRSNDYLHYVCAAPTLAGRSVGIMHGIINCVIEKYADSPYKLDFEGSENESVALFYRKFNPKEEKYLVFTK